MRDAKCLNQRGALLEGKDGCEGPRATDRSGCWSEDEPIHSWPQGAIVRQRVLSADGNVHLEKKR